MSVCLISIQEIQKLASEVKQHHDQLSPVVQHTDQYRRNFLDEYRFNREKLSEEAVIYETIGRCLWYAYIANVTAFNVQYRENWPIDFETDFAYDETIPAFVKRSKKVAEELRHLRYNIFTNDGNYFLADGYLEVLEKMIEALKNNNWY